MGLLVLIGASVLVAVGAGAVTRLLRPDSAVDAAVTFGVVTSAIITLVLEVTGIAGGLERGPVVALAALICLAAVAVERRTARTRSARDRWRSSISAGAATRAVRREPWAAMLAVLAGGALLWQAVVAIVLPPYAYDALTYHFTTVTTWVQQGDLGETPLSMCCANYPFTSDLMFAWPMLLAGDDSVVNTVQIGFAVLGALAVAGLARSLRMPPVVAMAAGALFAVTPIVLTQAPTGYVDLMLAAWVLAAIHAVVRFAVSADPRRLVVAALAAGMVLGTKGTGILWAVVLVASMVALVVVSLRGSRISVAGAATGLGAVLVACLALGSFWYLRNWIERDNPMHPFRVEVAGVVLFDGPKDLGATEAAETPRGYSWPEATVRSWAADLDFWNQPAIDYQQRLGGLGPLWAWLGLPLLLVGGVVLLRRRDPVTVALLAVAVVFALQPYKWWARFTIPLAGAGALAIAAAAQWAPRAWLRALVRVVSVPLAVAGVALASAKVVPAGRAEPLSAREVVRLATEEREERSLGRLFFHEYEFLEDVPSDATVVVDLEAEPVRFVYPLFGRDLDRRVVRLRQGTPLTEAWVVTGRDRAVDRRVEALGDHVLVSDRRGLRAWRPRP